MNACDLAPGWSRWPAPAKLNLCLRIVGRRADGYHELQTCFQLLDWGDDIDLLPTADGRVERLAGPTGVAAEQDLVVRAARLLQAECGVEQGVRIRVHKRIPLGGGFGGGSSDAATVLVALNALWGVGLDEDALAALGLKLGADVPVFVRGHSAWAEGIGEKLQPLDLPAHWFVVLDSGVSVPTAELFQAPELTRNAPRVKMPGFAFDWVGDNAFTPVLRARASRVDAALKALAPYAPSGLTGTGGGCFAMFTSQEAAEGAARHLQDEWRCWVARGINRSPLQLRLEAGR